MTKKAKKVMVALHEDQGGSYFVEMALVLIGVAFVVFNAASGLANDGIVPKYNNISTQIQGVAVPSLD
ncbi:MAG: hypothetical protein JL50_01040 [Peptococcaceae bacterium BICA1-7]|nr:MAG: hypothetical protein JL50_01040 [Peptococcaceae bacterium BICA1-7]HBV98025.1 hypothetical protein [Desulfotomaculum sp.]